MTILVILSGGMDSTAALALAVDTVGRGDDVRTMSFDYGQRHSRELKSARAVADYYDAPHEIRDVSGMLHGSSLLGVGDVPEGHYAEENMASTVVNGRNLLFASIGVSACEPGDELWLGVHAGDHPIYADCRPEFWGGLRGVVRDAYRVGVVTPFLNVPKADIARIGHELGAPFELTWSCYNGRELHCGRCGTCVERAEAFHLAGVPDPTKYEDPEFWREAVK